MEDAAPSRLAADRGLLARHSRAADREQDGAPGFSGPSDRPVADRATLARGAAAPSFEQSRMHGSAPAAALTDRTTGAMSARSASVDEAAWRGAARGDRAPASKESAARHSLPSGMEDTAPSMPLPARAAMDRMKSMLGVMRSGTEEDASRQVASAQSKIERPRHLFEVPEARITMAAQSSTMNESARSEIAPETSARTEQRDREMTSREQRGTAHADMQKRADVGQIARLELNPDGASRGFQQDAPPRSLSASVHEAKKMQANRLAFATQALTSNVRRFKTSAVQSVDSESEADSY